MSICSNKPLVSIYLIEAAFGAARSKIPLSSTAVSVPGSVEALQGGELFWLGRACALNRKPGIVINVPNGIPRGLKE